MKRRAESQECPSPYCTIPAWAGGHASPRYTCAEMKAIAAAQLELNPRLADNERTDGHVALECDCGNTGCMFCDGGLFACTRCGSFEGATTTDCPGRQIHLADEVYAGRLDYRIINGVGSWVAGPSSDTPALWTLACERAGVRP